MSEGKNVPKIRFLGFEGEWESEKLENYLTVSKSRNKDESFDKEDVLSVSGEFGIVNQIEFQGRSFAGESLANYGVVCTGDVVYTKSPLKSNPYGIIKSNRGKAGIVSTLYAVYKPKDNVDSEFVQLYFELDSRMNNYMHPLANKGAKNDMKVSDENALKGDVVFPSKKEQQEIKRLFVDIDGKINACRSELDKWKELKKSLLQKMFPKEGESVPEIRFPGFEDSWLKKKLSSVCELITVGIANSATHAYTNTGIIMFRNQNIKENYLDDEDLVYIDADFEVQYEKKRIKMKDILVTRTGNPGIACVVPKKYEGAQTFTTIILRLKEGVNPYYACQYINSDYGKRFFAATQIGGGQKNSGAGIIEEFPLAIPGSIEEQNKIADYLLYMDDFILKSQRECDKWKELKKGLLQQMFV